MLVIPLADATQWQWLTAVPQRIVSDLSCYLITGVLLLSNVSTTVIACHPAVFDLATRRKSHASREVRQKFGIAAKRRKKHKKEPRMHAN
jgi:hypothetical protein